MLATFRLPGRRALPLFSLDTGDIVTLFPERPHDAAALRGDFPSGTVYEKTRESITVAFHSEWPDWLETGPHYQLHRSLNRVTYKRMLEALDAVDQTQGTRLAVFRDLSLGLKTPACRDLNSKDLRWFDKTLNTSQKESVKKALEARDIFLVHGPPGTGKTTALVEFIRQSVFRKESVFVAAPSNTACDNVLERLVEKGLNALRLGHPARITASLREHTLDFKLVLHPLASEIASRQAELDRLFKKEQRYRDRRSPGREAEKEIKQLISGLRDENRRLRKEIFERVMKEAEVIVGTPAGIQDKAVREKEFDILVMDEATQATEPLSWIPMMHARKVVMAGDHFQLPPTVRSKEAEEKGLGISLFERFYDVLPAACKILLERQYRMNEKIMGFSSREFYENRLVADESVKSQTLAELPGVEKCALTEEPLVFIDTAGKGFEEKLEEGSESRYNPEEAALVLEELKKALAFGVQPDQIAVISPYSAQVRLLASHASTRLSTDPEIEIDSVDGFQGREKELVLVSLVRSNLEGELGFLADTRRMNVAMTRARRKLIVIGDSGTLASLSFYRDFMKYAEETGAYKSAWEL